MGIELFERAAASFDTAIGQSMSQRTFVSAGHADQSRSKFSEVVSGSDRLRTKKQFVVDCRLRWRGGVAGYFGARNFMRVIRRQRF